MRLLLLLLFFTYSAFAVINTPIKTEITSIDDEGLIHIQDIKGAQVGMYGLLIKHFNEKHSIALSWVEITEIQEGSIRAITHPIHALEQSALPSGNWVAKVGDEVILGYNYHRALLIAPNASVYKKVTTYHKARHWTHPDIFTTVLSSNGHPSPLKEDFIQTCRANNIGLVAFIFDKSILTIDCLSFKILQNKETALKTNEIQLPFYTRVVNIEEDWWGEGSSPLEEYAPYYVNLLATYNPENEWIQDYNENVMSEETLDVDEIQEEQNNEVDGGFVAQ